jgi:hypothetical protein
VFWCGDFQHQAEVPLVIHALDNHMLEDRSFGDRTMIDDLDFPDILEVEAYLTVLLPAKFAAISITVLDTLEAAAALETGKTWVFSGLQPAEESREGLVQPAEHLLDTCGVQHSEDIGFVVALISKVRPLCRVIDTLARLLIHIDTLLKSSIVESASLPEQLVKQVGLLLVRAQSVFVDADHLGESRSMA